MTFEKRFGSMLSSRAHRREERGAILVLSTVGLVLAMIAAGLAIDLGRIAQAARDDQKVADMAALDAARVLPADYAVAAASSAARNGFPTDPGYSVTAIEGVKTDGQCVAAAGAGSVCVTVTSPHKNAFPFLGGRDSVTRTAMAGAGNAIGTVRVGSSVVSASGSVSVIRRTRWGGRAWPAAMSPSVPSRPPSPASPATARSTPGRRTRS
jgi:uncharacterized membrane protein